MGRRARRRMVRLFLLAVVAGLILVGSGRWPSQGQTGADDPAEVVRVVDGDTVVVRLAGREEPVRLIGIDTPESVDPRSPVECFGRQASERTAALLPEGTAVRLVRDVEARDRYDRLLAYVYRAEDDTFVNLTLVEEGFASVATFPPNVAHTSDFQVAAARARDAGLGLWSACGGNE